MKEEIDISVENVIKVIQDLSESYKNQIEQIDKMNYIKQLIRDYFDKDSLENVNLPEQTVRFYKLKKEELKKELLEFANRL